MKFDVIKGLIILSAATMSIQCGSGGGVAVAALCSIAGKSADTSALTAKFSDSILSGLGLQAGFLASDDEKNDLLKNKINSAFESTGVSELINVASIKSVPSSDEDDGVRFLQLGGTFGDTVGVFASSFLKDETFSSVLSNSFNLSEDESPFDFLQDSFKVRQNSYEFKDAASPKLASDFNVKQWAYSQTDLETAKTAFAALPDNSNSEVIVAVIDTGVDIDHPALVDNFAKDESGNILGYDFVGDTSNADDDQGHGTHCAGIIAAKKVADNGMVGLGELLAPGKVKIMPIKVLGKDGGGSTTAINKGIRYAIKNGADVISMSLGGPIEFSDLTKAGGAENEIIREAVSKGIIVIVAAGNENCPLGGNCEQKKLLFLTEKIKEYTVVPCSYNGVICVGASDPDATLAEYSNYPSATSEKGVDPDQKESGKKRISPDIVGPGTDIYATYPGGEYKLLSGTSMATPFVAGLAALYKLKALDSIVNEPGAQKDFWNLLQNSETQLAEEGSEVRSFVGQVDLLYFVNRLKDSVEGTTTAAPPTIKPVKKPDAAEGERKPAEDVFAKLCGG